MKKLKIVLPFILLSLLLNNCKEEEIPHTPLDRQSFSNGDFLNSIPEDFFIRTFNKTPDGGFILAGLEKYNHLPFIKLSEEGALTWSNAFGPLATSPVINQVIPATDGGYLIAGYDHFVDDNAYLLKVDQNGYGKWERKFGGEFDQEIEQLIALEDGGYIFCGFTRTESQFQTDLYLGRVDQAGLEVWTSTKNHSNEDRGIALLQTNAEEFLVLSASIFSNPDVGQKEAVLFKYDLDGNLLWTQSYGSSGLYTLDHLTMVPANDGGFLILSTKRVDFNNHSKDFHLIKVDQNGIKEWEKYYGGTKNEEAFSITATDDNAFLLFGTTQSEGNGETDLFLVKIDASGKKQWTRTYGDERPDFPFNLVEKVNGGFTITGYQRNVKNGSYRETFLINVNAQGIPE